MGDMKVLHVGTAEQTRNEVKAQFAANNGRTATDHPDGTFCLGVNHVRYRLTLVGIGGGNWAFAVVENEKDA